AKRAARDARESTRKIDYPEWDYRKRAYRLPGASVWPSVASAGPEEWVGATLAERGAMLEPLRRRFEMLRARRLRLKRQLDGDDIDLDACIDHHTDLAAGRSTAEGLYELRRTAEHDLAVLLLIDVSGSTDGW